MSSSSSSSKRRESEYARARKRVLLVHLKTIGLVASNDALVFSYLGHAFGATLTDDAFLRTPTAAAHTAADRRTKTHSYYRQPSAFANDCVRVYWLRDAAAAADTSVSKKTIPNAYARIVHTRSGRTLNQLRDDFMSRYPSIAPPPSSGGASSSSSSTTSSDDDSALGSRDPRTLLDATLYPDALVARILEHGRRASAADVDGDSSSSSSSSASATKRRRVAGPLACDELTRALARVLGRRTTIATLQASDGSRAAYKDIALQLEATALEQRRLLLDVLAHVERLVWPTTTSSAAELAEARVAATNIVEHTLEYAASSSSSTAAAAERAACSSVRSASPPPPPPPMTSELPTAALEALMSAALGTGQ
jgi:hypothetical protein